MSMEVYGTLGAIGTGLSVAYSAYKYGNIFTRKKLFYKIAKFISTKIFNEIKDKKAIRELATSLAEKFDKKTLKELRAFFLDLVGLEEKTKKYNFDKFFRDNKDEILKNVENLKEYFIKRQIVEEFSLFVFARLYDCHIDIQFYKDLQYALIEDCVLNTKISAEEMIEKMEEVYEAAAIIDLQNFKVLEANFKKNQKELLDILDKSKANESSTYKRRFVGYIQEHIEAMKFKTEMVGKEANVDRSEASQNVELAIASNGVSSKNSDVSSKSDFLSVLNSLKADIEKSKK